MAIKSNLPSDDPDIVSQAELEQLFMPLDQEVISTIVTSNKVKTPLLLTKIEGSVHRGYRHCRDCFKYFIKDDDLYCSSQCQIDYRRCICCRKAFIPKTANHLYCSKQCTDRYSLSKLFNHRHNSYKHRYQHV